VGRILGLRISRGIAIAGALAAVSVAVSLRDQIQAENEKPSGSNGTVDSAKIASLQAEIQALEAKHQGEGLQMANQRAIMFMVGQDDAQRVYLETRDRGWVDSNNKQIRALGQAITK